VRRLAALVAIALLFASCTSDDGDGGAQRTSSPRSTASAPDELTIEEFGVPEGSHPHDVAPAEDGGVWYTAQGSGKLGYLDPEDGSTKEVPLGEGSRPHGVIVGPDGAPWITDGGLNAIVRVDPESEEVRTFPLPDDAPDANLNTAAFDNDDVLWFTGQSGVYGRLDTKNDSPQVEVFDAPGGRGPYGITATPSGVVYYASLAGDHIARIDSESGEATRIDPPEGATRGPRRVWSDSEGVIWISEWDAGRVSRYDPGDESWEGWGLAGDAPQAYAVFVDDEDIVWLSDFGGNAIVRFDPSTEDFTTLELPDSPGNVRQILGRPGEVWGAQSAADSLIRIRT
jgi:virginiamycin B lyase